MANTLRPGTIEQVNGLGYGATAEAITKLVSQGGVRQVHGMLEDLLRDADLPGGDAERGGRAAQAMAADLDLDLFLER